MTTNLTTPDGVRAVTSPEEYTPVINRDGLWYKREDAFRLSNGVNGSKLRACFHLATEAQKDGATMVVSAASVLSPQSPMGATVAQSLGMGSVTIVGGTTPDKAIRHQAIRMAAEQGSLVYSIPVGYNPALQSAARKMVAENEGYWRLPYGISTEDGSDLAAVQAFLEVGAQQVLNLPDSVQTLVLPFGSGNTAAGVLYGLLKYSAPRDLERVVLMQIGPNRRSWLEDRLTATGAPLSGFTDMGVAVEQIPLHPAFATYGDRMPETQDGIVFHPTYEGKIVRYLRKASPEWWTQRDGSTLLWVVGGPLP